MSVDDIYEYLVAADLVQVTTPLLVDSIDSSDPADGTILFRMSTSCGHGTSRANLTRLFEGFLGDGKDPQCVLCPANDGIHTSSYLMSLVQAGVISEETGARLLLRTVNRLNGVVAEFDYNAKISAIRC